VSKELLDSIFDGVYIVNPQRHIIFWNKGAEHITGHLREDVSGRWCGDNILNHIDENGILLCRTDCPLLKVIRTGIPTTNKVYPKTKAGHRIPTETHIGPIFNAQGEIIGAIEVFRDISVQEDYRILQEKFNALIKKYVSSATYQDVQARIRRPSANREPRILDLSVMYLDIVSFTAFTEKNPPEAVVEMLNDLFSICEVITREHYGDVDKYIGDALMAVFADARDAVNAAIKILGTGLPSMNEARAKAGQQTIQIRVGINSGPVLQGDIGSLERKDMTVIGDTVNTASRVEKVAQPDSLLISEATLSRLPAEQSACFNEFGVIPIRGKTEPLRLFICKQTGK